ncbi:MAG: hypothetical protein K0R48_1166 [Gammaproteobacteria bacterium]|nr:hypothetical protein [Gammaproteobacteria bacterium]
MGRIGITYQDVSAAISTLQAQGKPPTVDNIREVLRTGSKSTIVRLLREWKQQHGLLSNKDGSLPNDLLAMLKEFWLNLQTNTDGQHQTATPQLDLLMVKQAATALQAQELQKKHNKLELACAKISQNYARMSQELNVQRQALEAKNKELMECQRQLGMAENHVDYLQNTLFATEDKLIALQDDYLFLSRQKANLEGQVKQLQKAGIREL